MTYFVTSTTGDTKWHKTNATTLRAAKAAASKMYEQSFNGRIEVGKNRAEDNAPSIEVVAVKYGYDNKWVEV